MEPARRKHYNCGWTNLSFRKYNWKNSENVCRNGTGGGRGYTECDLAKTIICIRAKTKTNTNCKLLFLIKAAFLLLICLLKPTRRAAVIATFNILLVTGKFPE